MPCRLLFIAAVGLIVSSCGGGPPAVEIINKCPPEPPEIACPILDMTEPETLAQLQASLAESRFAAGACRALADAWLSAWQGC